jgi:diguanylate cyclase (GGDEF)-like protein/PAS domain S-box-containing protein
VLPWLATILRAQLDAMAPDDPRRAQVAKERSRVARQAGRLSRWYANNRPHALRELAYLQAGRGHLRAARRLLTESIATAERQGADHELAESREARGQIGRRVGWPDAAQDLAVAEGLRLPHTPESGTARPATLSLADRFDGLVESGRAIAAATSPATIRDETKRAASLLLRGDRCGVVDLNDDDAEIDPAVIAMVKLAVSSGRPVSGNTAGSLLCAPINVDGRPVACLYAAHDTIPGLFAEEEEQVASFLTTLAGAALEHAADSQARFRALIQNASDVIAIVDAEGHVSYISPSVKRITGFAPEDVVGRDLTMLAPSARDQMSEALTTALQDALARPMVEVLALGADGAPVHLQLTYTNLFSTPSISGIVVNAHDVTERRRADAAASMFQIAFESAPIGMAMTSVRPDRAGTFLRVNEALADMLGYERSELEGINIRDLTHPDDQGADSDALARMASGASVSHEVEKRYRHADGRWVWVHLKASVVFDGPDPDFAISQMVDITEQRAVAEQLIHQALHDPLTGLPNRRLLHERLNRALLASNRRGRQLAVLYLDLDRFKGVNDSFGHEVGDQVLVEVTARLSRLLRSSDTLARLGGDEFVIVLEDVHSHQDVDDVVDRIHAVLNQPVRLSTGGEASIATSGDDPETLLRDADTALYSAKEDGRARSAVFNESLRTRIVGRMDAERDLREAMAADRLELRYQPIVDLGTGHTVGAEALVRYRDGNGRLVRPSEFIDIAEETGLIIPLGAWVLRAACVQLSRWRVGHGLDDFRLTVNVSPRQIAAPDFVELVEQTLRETGVPASSLAIEVTEGRLLEAEASRPKLRQLQRLGCEVGIDDFGTGYSCLAYLRELPIDFVKIDQSFVDGVATDPARGAMIGAIVELMAALGLRAVVEGVETPEQWASLRTLGCTYGQGYVFGNPKTSEDFLRFLPDAA